jgi:hypothetical protein
MHEALRSAGWMVLAVVLGAYLTFLVASDTFNATPAAATPVVVRDVLREGEHHLYGKIVVPSSCDEVSIQTVNTSATTYDLQFTTWPEPEVKCINAPAERVFDTVIFAPSVGVEFTASIDKTPVPLAVYPILSNSIIPN